MKFRTVLTGVLLCAPSFVIALRAQEGTPVASSRDTHNAAALLDHTIALHLEHVTRQVALTAIGVRGGVQLVYSRDQLVLDDTVSLVTGRITVGDALRVVLQGTGLGVFPLADQKVALGPVRPALPTSSVHPAPQQQGTATLSGSVTDSGTSAAIAQVTVHIDGTSLSVKSGTDGVYKILNIVAGEYHVTARRVGYLAKTSTITVADGDNKKLDFQLNQPATQLNEVVTTALGEQRRYQVGNVISTINVDSIAPTAPITSVTDLISGRAPGVEVMAATGLVGDDGAIRIRGQSSLLLQSDPIIIVDGIRVDNAAGGSAAYNVTLSQATPGPARINDLDFNEIATINILKGPAATVEYGTDAANGVIVITTKRGVSGHPQWSVAATYSAQSVPSDLQNYYWNWGHRTNGLGTSLTNTPYTFSSGDCTLGPLYNRPSLTTGSCVVDSTTAFNPLNHAATSEYGTGPGERYHLSVRGGNDQIQYYFATGLNDQSGVTHLPPVFRSEAIGLGFPGSSLNPNSENQGDFRANMSVTVSPTMDVITTVAYMSTHTVAPSAGATSLGTAGAYPEPVFDDSVYNYGYGTIANGSPLALLGQQSNAQTNRWIGQSELNWRPMSLLHLNVDVGLDHNVATAQYETLPITELVAYNDTSSGVLNVSEGVTDTYTATLRGTNTVSLLHFLQVTTTFGGSYVESNYSALIGSAFALSASDYSLNATTAPRLNQSLLDSRTAGIFLETNLAVGEGGQCNLPIAIGLNGGSGYGAAVTSVSDPKLDISCTVLTGATTLRVRAAYGVAGQQPPYGSTLPQYQLTATGNATLTDYDFAAPGNQYLVPETSQEWEGGVDWGFWHGRLQGQVTGFSKLTHHAIQELPLSADLGPGPSFYENLGEVRNSGYEASLTATLLQSRLLSWSATINTSVTNDKLISLDAGAFTPRSGTFTPGYPLYGYWANPVLFSDVNHDGIIERAEITVGPSNVFQGASLPATESSLATSVGCWRNVLLLQALFDYKTGFKVLDEDNGWQGQGMYEPVAPLWEQVRGIAVAAAPGNVGTSYFDGSFLRFRELSASYTIPAHLVRAVHLHNLSVVGAVRNLGLWTRYPFGDPEVSSGAQVINNTASATATVNNDLRSTSPGVVPLPRIWNLGLRLGW